MTITSESQSANNNGSVWFSKGDFVNWYIKIYHIRWLLRNLNIAMQWHRQLFKKMPSLHDVAQSFAIRILEQWHTHTQTHTETTAHTTQIHIYIYIYTMSLNDDASLSTSGGWTESPQTKDLPSFFTETTDTAETPRRATIPESRSSVNGISGRLSTSERINEMPALTRVCSPATLPRFKKFRFQPIDGELLLST